MDLFSLLVAMPLLQALTVGGLPVPWSTIITIAAGGAGWANLRASVKAGNDAAARAEKNAGRARAGVQKLKIRVATLTRDIRYIRRELDLANGRIPDPEPPDGHDDLEDEDDEEKA